MIKRSWVACALCAAAVLLVLAPDMHARFTWPVFLLYLHLPLYMLHQVEEHAGDRFRIFVNHIFRAPVLSTATVIVINLPLTWGLNGAAFIMAVAGHPSWALAAPYLMLVNAILHIAGAVRWKRYNPGFITAIILFLPLAAITLRAITATPTDHVVGLGMAVLVHAGIVAWVVLRHRTQITKSQY